MPPPKDPPLREEPELLDRPKPPERLGEVKLELPKLDGDEVDGRDGVVRGVLPKERCDWLGLEIALALAAILSALGDAAGLEITGWEEVLTVEPAVRDFIEPL